MIENVEIASPIKAKEATDNIYKVIINGNDYILVREPCEIRPDKDKVYLKTLDGNVAFIETAILAESGLDKVVDSVWQVVADENVRIKRVVERNNMLEQNVKERIAAQTCVIPDRLPVNFIDNNGDKSILPQIMSLLNILD